MGNAGRRLAVVIAAGLSVATRAAAAQDQKDEVLKAGQAVFDAMGKRDTAALRTLLHPIAHFVATIQVGDSVVVRGTTRDEFFGQIASINGVPRERMWDAEVRVSGTIASIWTPYDFHLGTTFSHCGVDSFQLVQTNRGWQVTSITYTVVRPAERCKPSPLGAPR